MIRNSRGFTLIELLVALVILTVALVPLTGLFVQGRAVAAGTWDEVTAVSLAQGKMEQLKGAPFGTLADEGPVPFPDPFGAWYCAVAVQPVRAGLAEITVTVTAGATGEELCRLKARRARR